MDDKSCSPCDQEVIEKSPPCPLQCMSPKCKSFKPLPQIDTSKTPIIWMLGNASVMKAQCEKLIPKFGFAHLSTGNLLRAEISSGSDRAKCLTSAMDRHDLVPNDVVSELLKKAILAKSSTAKGFIITDFPRQKAQGIFFEKNVAPAAIILYFETSSDKMPAPVNDMNSKPVKISSESYKEIVEHWPNKMNRINAEGAADAITNEVTMLLQSLFQ